MEACPKVNIDFDAKYRMDESNCKVGKVMLHRRIQTTEWFSVSFLGSSIRGFVWNYRHSSYEPLLPLFFLTLHSLSMNRFLLVFFVTSCQEWLQWSPSTHRKGDPLGVWSCLMVKVIQSHNFGAELTCLINCTLPCLSPPVLLITCSSPALAFTVSFHHFLLIPLLATVYSPLSYLIISNPFLLFFFSFFLPVLFSVTVATTNKHVDIRS